MEAAERTVLLETFEGQIEALREDYVVLILRRGTYVNLKIKATLPEVRQDVRMKLPIGVYFTMLIPGLS